MTNNIPAASGTECSTEKIKKGVSHVQDNTSLAMDSMFTARCGIYRLWLKHAMGKQQGHVGMPISMYKVKKVT